MKITYLPPDREGKRGQIVVVFKGDGGMCNAFIELAKAQTEFLDAIREQEESHVDT